MIRQARRYLVGAVSSVTLISIAIVAFVILVSAQVFKDWPIGDLGGGDQSSVSEASAVSANGGFGATAPKTVRPGAAATAAGAPRGAGGNQSNGDENRVAAPEDSSSVGSGAPPATESEPVASVPASTGSPGASPSDPASPSTPTQSSPSASGGGGNATGISSSGGGSKGSGGAKSPTEVVEDVVQPVTGGGGSTTAKVTEAVNETVNSVDESVTGGALEEAGVTGQTEEVVNGVVGPESALGKTVDETANAVGGLLGGNK
ncbi:MAG: hypothetical protein AB7V58_05695 [Solirubrobacterales bacterium]